MNDKSQTAAMHMPDVASAKNQLVTEMQRRRGDLFQLLAIVVNLQQGLEWVVVTSDCLALGFGSDKDGASPARLSSPKVVPAVDATLFTEAGAKVAAEMVQNGKGEHGEAILFSELLTRQIKAVIECINLLEE